MENTNKNENIDIVDTTQNKITVVNDGLNVFERMILIVKKYSIWHLLKTIFILVLFGMAFFFILNPIYFFEKYEEYSEQKHTIELTDRFNKSKDMNAEINDALFELHADRVFFIEYHNSVKSLQGAPFAYGSMSFEKIHPNRDVIYMADEFTDFPLTKYEIVSFLYDEKSFIGRIDELKNIDERLSLKLRTNDVTQIALIEVWGDNQPLGILGATWSNYEVLKTYENSIEKIMRQRASQIRLILNA